MKTKKRNNLLVSLAAFMLLSCLVFLAFSTVSSRLSGLSGKILGHKGEKSSGPIRFKANLNNRFYYDNNQVYLHINLNADKVVLSQERTPLNISIVIDRSGSMDDRNKLTYVKKAVEHVIDNLSEGDYVSIVSYNDDVTVLQETIPVGSKYDLNEKINKLKASGFTNLSGGMFEGFNQVNKSFKRGYVNRVLLLSDGLANRGLTDRYKLAAKVRDLNRDEGIVVSTFGVGTDFNEDLMTDIAEYGRGNYYYIKDSEQIPDIFAQELNGIRTLVGQNTKVTVKFPSRNLILKRVYGYPYDSENGIVTIDFKDMFSGQVKSVLLKFDIVRPLSPGVEFENELTYEDVTNSFRFVRETEYCRLNTAVDRAEYDKGFDESVQQNVAMFETNDLMEQALQEADKGNYTKAKDYIETGRQYMNDQMGSIQASPEMKRQLEGIEKYKKDLDNVESKTEEEKKDMQKSGKYENYNTRKNNQ